MKAHLINKHKTKAKLQASGEQLSTQSSYGDGGSNANLLVGNVSPSTHLQITLCKSKFASTASRKGTVNLLEHSGDIIGLHLQPKCSTKKKVTWWDNVTCQHDTFYNNNVNDIMFDRKWSDIQVEKSMTSLTLTNGQMSKSTN